MNHYKKIILLQWGLILFLLISVVYQFNKNSEFSDEITSLSSQVDELKGPTEAYDVSDQISDLRNTVSKHSENLENHQDEILSLTTRLAETENSIEKNTDKLDDLCLVKNICI